MSIHHTLHHPTPHVHWLSADSSTDRPVLGAISGESATLIVDAGNSPAHAALFLQELAQLQLAPLKYLVLTHWHWDHVFGTQAINLPSFAHVETKRIVTEMAHMDWSDRALDRRVEEGSEIVFCRDNIQKEMPDRRGLVIRPPEISFDCPIELDLGGVTCQIVPVGGDHDIGSTVVCVAEDKVLFLGDCLSEDYYSGPPSYTTRNLFPLIQRVLGLDADIFLGGHATQPMSRAEMEADLNEMKAIGLEVERIVLDREAVMTALPGVLGAPLNEDQVEVADSFLAGLRKFRP